MTGLSNLVKSGVIYGFGDFSSRLVAFAALPVLAANLGPSGFGLLDLAFTIAVLGGSFVRLGMNSAVQRYYWELSPADGTRMRLASTGLAITIFLGLMAVLVLALTALAVSTAQGLPSGITWIGVLGVAMLLPATQWLQYSLDLLRLRFAAWGYVSVALGSRTAAAVISVLMVIYWSADADHVLLAQGFATLLFVPLGLFLVRDELKVTYDPSLARKLMIYGSPLMVAEIGYWLFSSIDKWMLATLSGLDSVGIYGMAFRFSMVVTFIATAFGMAWSPYSMKIRSELPTQHRSIYAEVLLILIVSMTSVASVISLFAEELLLATVGVQYADAAVPLIILSFTAVLQATQQVTAVGLSLTNRTAWMAGLVWASAAINALLNTALIPSFGVAGSAWATFVSYLFLTLCMSQQTQRHYPLPYSRSRFTWIILLSLIMLVVSVVQNSQIDGVFGVTARVALVIAYVALAMPAIRLKSLMDQQHITQS